MIRRHMVKSARASLAAMIPAVLLGCGDRPQPGPADRPSIATSFAPATERADQTRTELAQAEQEDDGHTATLAAMCGRAARRVSVELEEYQQQFSRNGLPPPAHTRLTVQGAMRSCACDQAKVVIDFVCRRLAEELGRLDGIEIELGATTETAPQATLAVDTLVDFNSPFDALVCTLVWRLPQRQPVAWVDRIADYGLVYIDGPEGSSDLLVAVAGDRLRSDFTAQTKTWHLIPRGRYAISIRSEQTDWRAEVAIGAQAVLDLRAPSPADLATPQRPCSVSRAVAPTPVPKAKPRLSILSPRPSDGAVARCITVSGCLEPGDSLRGRSVGAVVSIIVTVDRDYIQSETARVGLDGRWSVARVLLGRAGRLDAGTTFQIRAQARTLDGHVIESERIFVTRQ